MFKYSTQLGSVIEEISDHVIGPVGCNELVKDPKEDPGGNAESYA